MCILCITKVCFVRSFAVVLEVAFFSKIYIQIYFYYLLIQKDFNNGYFHTFINYNKYIFKYIIIFLGIS